MANAALEHCFQERQILPSLLLVDLRQERNLQLFYRAARIFLSSTELTDDEKLQNTIRKHLKLLYN